MNRIEAARLKRPLVEAVIATIVLTFMVPCARAQTYDYSWNGGTGAWYSNPSNWAFPPPPSPPDSERHELQRGHRWHCRRSILGHGQWYGVG
jgi:hypothetical protein